MSAREGGYPLARIANKSIHERNADAIIGTESNLRLGYQFGTDLARLRVPRLPSVILNPLRIPELARRFNLRGRDHLEELLADIDESGAGGRSFFYHSPYPHEPYANCECQILLEVFPR